MFFWIKSRYPLFAAIFLVAGTCIGGGMLALPVDTSAAGFTPSLFSLALCWLFMYMTGLFYVEVALWMEEGAHIMTMSERLLGSFGKVCSFLLFIFMGYASLVAYNSGGAFLFQGVGKALFSQDLSYTGAVFLFTLSFGTLFLLGARFIGKMNAILVVSMIATYIGLSAMGISKVDLSLLQQKNFMKSFTAFPILLTVFSYQMIIPTLVSYVKRDKKVLQKALFWGTFLAFGMYAIWEWIVLGTVPHEGQGGLLEAFEAGKPATEPFRQKVKHPYLMHFSDTFAFFAIVTSYLGIGLGFFDFLADSFRMKKQGKQKLYLTFLVVFPSFLLALFFPKAFRFALEVTGGFGDAILGGALPVLLLFSGRYFQRKKGEFTVKGGKPLLTAAFAFSLWIIFLQIKNFF